MATQLPRLERLFRFWFLWPWGPSTGIVVLGFGFVFLFAFGFGLCPLFGFWCDFVTAYWTLHRSFASSLLRPLNQQTAMCLHQLTMATICNTRPGGSHEGVGRKKWGPSTGIHHCHSSGPSNNNRERELAGFKGYARCLSAGLWS